MIGAEKSSTQLRQGLRFHVPICSPSRHVLSPRIVRDLAEVWRRLDERIDHLSDEIIVLARQDTGM